MMIIIGLAIAMIAGWLICRYTSLEELGLLLMIIPCVVLGSILICWPMVYMEYGSQVQAYHATKRTIANIRKPGAEIERAALVHKIAKVNEDLAIAKFWNNSVFDVFVPDEITKLEELK